MDTDEDFFNKTLVFLLHIYIYMEKQPQNTLSEHLQSCTLLQTSATVFPALGSEIRHSVYLFQHLCCWMEEGGSQFLPCFYLLCVISAQTGYLEGGTLESSLQ